jgi:hypothetical protein
VEKADFASFYELGIFLEQLRKTMKIPSQGSPYVGKSLKLETAEHEERFLTN